MGAVLTCAPLACSRRRHNGRWRRAASLACSLLQVFDLVTSCSRGVAVEGCDDGVPAAVVVNADAKIGRITFGAS